MRTTTASLGGAPSLPSRRNGFWAGALVLLGALGVFCLHALFFKDYIIDDAGISYAYARNLANGAGLVAQPGAAPVEAFSNPLWVMVLAGAFELDAFDPVYTPKVLGSAWLRSRWRACSPALVVPA